MIYYFLQIACLEFSISSGYTAVRSRIISIVLNLDKFKKNLNKTLELYICI